MIEKVVENLTSLTYNANFASMSCQSPGFSISFTPIEAELGGGSEATEGILYQLDKLSTQANIKMFSSTKFYCCCNLVILSVSDSTVESQSETKY